MAKRWAKTEIAHLKRHAATKTVDELAQRLATEPEAVRKKLEELGLVGGRPATGPDPAVLAYEAALALLHERRWAEAATAFEGVLEVSDSRMLSDRARQHLLICRRHTNDEAEAEPYVTALVEKNRGNYEAAAKLAAKVGSPQSDERAAYLAASIAALSGDLDGALDLLRIAVRLEPRNRVHAYHDPDFAALRGRDELKKLLAGD